jgi:hypothetical protein
VTADENLQLIRTIEANREFMLTVYRQNPALLASAEDRIKALFEPLPEALKSLPGSPVPAIP